MAPRRREALSIEPLTPLDWRGLLQIDEGTGDATQALELQLSIPLAAARQCIEDILARGGRADADAWCSALALPRLAALLAADPHLAGTATVQNGAFRLLNMILLAIARDVGPDNPLADACAAAGIPAALLAALMADAKAGVADSAGRWPAHTYRGAALTLALLLGTGAAGALPRAPFKAVIRCAIATLERFAHVRCVVTPQRRLTGLTRMLDTLLGITNHYLSEPEYREALDAAKAARLRTAAAVATRQVRVELWISVVFPADLIAG